MIATTSVSIITGADIDDHMVVTVQYDSGLVATLFFAIFGPWATDQETLEIVGDSGRLRMERHSGDIDLVERYGHARSKIRHPDPRPRYVALSERTRNWYERLSGSCWGEAPPVGVAQGVASLRLVQAAQISLAQDGRPVDPRDLVMVEAAQ